MGSLTQVRSDQALKCVAARERLLFIGRGCENPQSLTSHFFTMVAVAFDGSGPDGPSTTNFISFVDIVFPTHEAPGRNSHTV